MLKCWNHSTTTRNYAVNYYKTLEGIPWHLELKELKNVKNFQKSLKKMKISIKLRVFSDRLFLVVSEIVWAEKELKGSMSTLCPLGATCLSLFSGQKSQTRQAKNRSSKK